MHTKEELKSILASLEKQHALLAAELEQCPDYNITEENRSGRYELLAAAYKPKRTRIRLRDNRALAVQLVRKLFLRKQLAILQKNCDIIAKAIKNWQVFDSAEASYGLKQQYKSITQDVLEAAMRSSAASEWASEEYEQLNYKPEEKRHITSRGERMRSKSEMLIAELLYSFGIEFRYEQIVRIGSKTFAPDFTIRLADGRIIYWEHMGKTSDKDYVRSQFRKIEYYAESGIVPWDNLIVTFDDTDGNLDIRSIKSIIVNRLAA